LNRSGWRTGPDVEKIVDRHAVQARADPSPGSGYGLNLPISR
jgi:hypothetical protein